MNDVLVSMAATFPGGMVTLFPLTSNAITLKACVWGRGSTKVDSARTRDVKEPEG